MKLSIIVPVYNEEKTVAKVMRQLQALDFSSLGLQKEIIVVDDASTDNTRKILSSAKGIKFLKHVKNQGKGGAVVTGIKNSNGQIIAIQDADLEYNPKEFLKLVKPILDGKTDVVYGSRFKGKIIGRHFLLHEIGNRALSLTTAILYFHWISDMETCYKVFKRHVLKGVTIKSRRFDFEPEITAKILKRGYRILEMPITYSARTKQEGKKIGIGDGFIALKTLLKYRFLD